jgi:hypothetical protein
MHFTGQLDSLKRRPHIHETVTPPSQASRNDYNSPHRRPAI